MHTAHDVIYYLMTSVGGGSQDQEQRILRSAVHHAWRDVVFSRDWLWHTSQGEIEVIAVATMDNPSSEIHTVTAYPLPVDCKNIDRLYTDDPSMVFEYVAPKDWARLNHRKYPYQQRSYYSVIPSARGTREEWVLAIAPNVPAGTKLNYTYRRDPQPLVLLGTEPNSRQGFVKAAENTEANYEFKVIGDGTNFPQRCDNMRAVIRFSENKQSCPEPLSGLNPYIYEDFIVKRENRSTLLLEHMIPNNMNELALFQDPSSLKYVISDYLDCSNGMFTAILSYAEMWYARLSSKPMDGAMALAQRDIQLAMESDAVAPISGRRWDWNGFCDVTLFDRLYTGPVSE